MATTVNFGAANYAGWFDYTNQLLSSDISVPARRTAANGKGPQLITAVSVYVAGYTTTTSMKLYADGKKTSSFTRTADSTPGSTGLKSLTSDLYIANGTTVTFGVSDNSDGLYFYHASSGGSVKITPNGYTWTGTLAGGYSYIESPTAPRTLTATPSTTVTGQVNLSWTAPSDNGGSSITNYNVYTVSGGTYTLLGSTTGTTYSATGLTANTSYTFAVRARNLVTDTAGTQSVDSNLVTATAPYIVPPSTAPSAPQSLVATTSTTTLGAVNLSWSAPSSSGSSAISDYYIYVDGVYQGALGGSSLASTPDYVVTGLTELSTYSFTVAAVNASGTGPQSSAASGKASGLPTAPTNLSVTADLLVSGRLNLAWDAPTDSGGGISGYRIYNASNDTLVVDQSGTGTTYSHNGRTAGVEYSYYVRAYNAIGIAQTPDAYGPASDTASATATTVTGAPSVVASAAIPSRLILSWSPTDGASTYLITNVTTGATKTVSSNVTTYAWDGLSTDTQYGFTKTPDNSATSDVGYGTTGLVATQSVSGTKTVTNLTNTQLSTTSAVITSATPTSFTYSKTGVSNLSETQILSVANSTAVNKVNEALTDADGAIQTTISAVGEPNKFSYVNSNAPDLSATNVSGGVTLLNRTNKELNSDSVTVTSVNAGAKTFSYAKSTDGAVITGNISNVSSGGTATNLSQTYFNVTNEPITEVTEYTVSYAKTAADQSTSAASGTIVNATNKDVFNNNVSSVAVVTAPDYKTVTYSLVPKTKVSISTTARSTTTVTVTTASAHSFKAGDTVYITGSTNGSGAFNGTWTILGVADSTHFTFTHGTSGTVDSASDTAATADINVSQKTVTYPVDSVTRLTSNSETNLDIIYRSGWIG